MSPKFNFQGVAHCHGKQKVMKKSLKINGLGKSDRKIMEFYLCYGT